MPQYLYFVIPGVLILIVFIIGFSRSRSMLANYQQNANPDGQPDQPKHSGVYEAANVVQDSDHPLGAVQSVVRGRIRFLLFGLMLIGIALFGLWALYFSDILTEYTETELTKLIATVIFAGAIIWGLQMISYITYRVTLRRTGFSISSVFGSKEYAYQDAEFYLNQTIERKYDSQGYRPSLGKTETYNYIWQCQILFRDARKPIVLKSSRYAWLKSKMGDMIDHLYGA